MPRESPESRSWVGFGLGTAKIVVPVALVAWLITGVISQPTPVWEHIQTGPSTWPLLAGAFSLGLAAVVLTFVRWYFLVRALDLTFSLVDAFRLGFLGYLFNFVSLGSVGGDLFKAVFIAQQQPERRTEAVASVIVDRVIGLYGLLVVAAIALAFMGDTNMSSEMVALARAVHVALAVGTIAGGMLFWPGLLAWEGWDRAAHWPVVGGTLERLIAALRAYADRPLVLVGAAAISLVVQTVNSLAIWLAAMALFTNAPGMLAHLVIVPAALVAGSVPLMPAGLGAFEAALEYLYRAVAMPAPIAGAGLAVALAYRVITIAVAAIGGVFHVACREEVARVIDEADADATPHEVPEEADKEPVEV